MKESYRGYLIEAKRQKCLGGWENLYYSVMRESDWLEVIVSLTDGNDTDEEYIGYMKKRVDDFIETRGASEDLEDWF